MRTLNLTFKGSHDKKHSLKLSYASNNLDEKTVRAAMEEIAQAHLFVKDDEDIYLVPLSAKYVDTVSTVIFNDDHK